MKFFKGTAAEVAASEKTGEAGDLVTESDTGNLRVADGTTLLGALKRLVRSDEVPILSGGKVPVSTLPAATTAAIGALELATDTEVETATDTARAITPAGLRHAISNGAVASDLSASYVGKWKASTAYLATDIRMAPDGRTIRRNADGTSRATYDATEQAAWTVIGGADITIDSDGTLVVDGTTVELGTDAEIAAAIATAAAAKLSKSSNLGDLPDPSAARGNLGLGGSATKNIGVTAGDVAAGDAPTAAAANAALLNDYGQLSGLPKALFNPKPGRGPNLWNTTYFYQGSTLGPVATVLNKVSLTPQVVASGSNQHVTTRIVPPLTDNQVTRYRMILTVDILPFSGGAGQPSITVGMRGSGAYTTVGTDQVILFANDFPGATNGFRSAYEFDFVPNSFVAIDIDLYSGTHTTGFIKVVDIKFIQVEQVTPTIRVGYTATPASGVGAMLAVSQPIGYNAAGSLMRAHRTFGFDGTAGFILNGLYVYPDAAYQSPLKANSSIFGNRQPQNQIHVSNCAQIFGVYKADGVTQELRGNTHGGETDLTGTFATDYQVYADYADGNGWTLINDYPCNHGCYRVKIVCNTKITRSDQPGTPFVLVTTTYYLYGDGTVRVDRTNTFQQAQKLSIWITHMTSLNPATNSLSRFRGRVGAGRRVLSEVDYMDRIAGPVWASSSVNTSGGTVPASPTSGGWSVLVTALTPFGESQPNVVGVPAVTTTGATNSITVNWTAAVSPAGVAASGYAIYIGYPGFERLAGTAAAGATSYEITAMPLGTAAAVPVQNTGYTGSWAPNHQIGDGPLADWSAIYDPNTKSVYSLAVDRDALMAHTGVTGVRGTVQFSTGSLAKNYWHLNMNGPGGDFPYTVPSGTVYQDTLWFFSYLPASQREYEAEQTVRAANVKSLPNLYRTDALPLTG